jgi:ABC-2 type transport system permease protein
MQVTVVSITAMDSWVQFFKNIPMALIAFALLQSSIFTKEYITGTLVLSLTKGLCRFQVVIAKAGMLLSLWTVGYWLCFGITYGYNAYFWDNSVAQNLVFSIVCWWLFGVLVISLMALFSTLSSSTSGVLMGVGGVVFASYLVGMIPKIGKLLPTKLTDGNSLIYGLAETKDYTVALVIAAVVSIVCFASSVPIFNKKQL